ncbi:hypothetical protein [Mesorhizobium australicum]|uniref:hypothetical protein n=1 Tax=Mesorhizobium australicum TaxID=536018 RepID=UPI00333909DB
MRQRILQKVLLDRVVLRHRYQGLPHVGMDLGAQRIEKREQSADDLGGKFLLLDLLLCSVEDQRQLRASGFERFAMMLGLSSTETTGDRLGSDKALAIKHGLHTRTPWLTVS